MGRHKISIEAKGIVKCLIKQNILFCEIQKELLELGHPVSLLVHYVAIRKEWKIFSKGFWKWEKRKGQNRWNATSRVVIGKVAAMITKVNPPTQYKMIKGFGVSASTIWRIICKILKAHLRKKCKMHKLSMTQVKTHHQFSLKLYQELNGEIEKHCDFWPSNVLSWQQLCKKTCLFISNTHISIMTKLSMSNNSFAPEIMAWAQVCSYSKTKLCIIDKGDKAYSNDHFLQSCSGIFSHHGTWSSTRAVLPPTWPKALLTF